jgi:MoaA/NifB/PqqE/SkfB family radical SAM enzyme
MLRKLGSIFQSEAQKPYSLFQIEAALECNLECVMCPWRELHPEEALMSPATFAKIAPYLPLTATVDFTGGGEPTTNPRLPEMVRQAKEAGCEVGFSSNGTLLDRSLAETLVSLKQDWISFSVDGATAETYENIRQGAQFDTVAENIHRLHQTKAACGSQIPKMMMVFVMMRENFHELPLYVDLAHQLGVEQIIFKNLDVILKDEDDRRRVFGHNGPQVSELNALISEAQHRAQQHHINIRLYSLQPQELPICEHDPLHNLFFNWQGYVSPCITLSYAEQRMFNGHQYYVPCQRYGNINAETLEEIWTKAPYRQFRQPYEHRVRQDREQTINLIVGNEDSSIPEMPPAPEGCRTCYYLYGV